MNYNPEIHHRKSIRLKGYDYSSNGAYFITICVKNRECLFGEIIKNKMNLSEIGKIAHKFWQEIANHFENVQIDNFVIMPNHVHGIIVINNVGVIHELPLLHELQPQSDDNFPENIKRRKMLIPKIIGRYKMNVSKNINQIIEAPAMSIWQRNYYEHIIRSEKSLNAIREYIINNPLKWALDKENPLNKLTKNNISEIWEEENA